MRLAIGSLLVLLALVPAPGSAQGNAQNWIGGSPVNTRVVVGADGETYLGVWVDAPAQVAGHRGRGPMALSLVIDNSGSMSGEKIQHARMAASSMLESLVDGDVVSIFAFNSNVVPIVHPTVVNRQSRATLMRAVNGIYAGGGTALYSGVNAAMGALSRAPRTHEIRRMVLISDGMATTGPTDPQSFAQLAVNGTEYAVQVSSIGVGLDYDESILGTLAARSMGRLYHLQHPQQMASILQREMQNVASTLATNVVLEINPSPGVTLIETVGFGAQVQNNRLRIPLGTVFAGYRREILVRVRVGTGQLGSHSLATAELKYHTAGNTVQQIQRLPLGYEVTRSARAAAASAAPRVQMMVANYAAAEAEQQAAAALNRGDRAEAERHYARAGEVLEDAAAAPTLNQALRQRLQTRSGAVRRSRRRAASAASPQAARAAALESNSASFDALSGL